MVGIARTAYLVDQLGPVIMDATRKVKRLFDPKGLMNPGKIVADGRYEIDTHLRQGIDSTIQLNFEEKLAYSFKDESFIGNLEQCNGCGGCRKDIPTMCPTYVATGEESMSTRGRSNVIRAALENRLERGLSDPVLEEALASCLACKACASECPSNVNLALLKAELLHAKHRQNGMSLKDRLVSRVDIIGQLGSIAPGVTNFLMSSGLAKSLLKQAAGFSPDRPLPQFATQTFASWFKAHAVSASEAKSEVLLWDDCFTQHYDPEIGRSAVSVLEAAGYAVRLPAGRACCGRPALSTGRIDLAREWGKLNVGILNKASQNMPVIFLEPSCWSMFKEDYRELGVPGADEASNRVVQFDEFLAGTLRENPDALSWKTETADVAIHTHCHTKAIDGPSAPMELANLIPNLNATLLDTGCCGMAGAYGSMDETYALSVQVGAHLKEKVDALPSETAAVASGTSCRHQFEHLCERPGRHMAQVVDELIAHP